MLTFLVFISFEAVQQIIIQRYSDRKSCFKILAPCTATLALAEFDKLRALIQYNKEN